MPEVREFIKDTRPKTLGQYTSGKCPHEFGLWSVPVVRLFNKMRDKVRDKLSKKQYDDEVSWTTARGRHIDGAAHVGGAAHGGGVGDWMPVSCRSRVAGAEDEAALFGGGVADSVA